MCDFTLRRAIDLLSALIMSSRASSLLIALPCLFFSCSPRQEDPGQRSDSPHRQRLNHIHCDISFVLLISYSASAPRRMRKVLPTDTVSYWGGRAGGKLRSRLRWTSWNWIWRFTLAGPRWVCRVKTKGQVPQLVPFSSPAHLIVMEYVSLRNLGCWVNLHLSSGDGEGWSKGTTHRFCIIILTAGSESK